MVIQYRVVNIPCVLYEPITVQGRQGMEEVNILERKTTAVRAFGHLHKLFSMRTTLSAGVP